MTNLKGWSPGLILAVLAVAALGYITLNSASSKGTGSKGLPAGSAPPPFAMPLRTSSCAGACDADVAVRPNQGAAGTKPACQVRGEDVLNSCQLGEEGPYVVAFVFQPLKDCRDQLPALERAQAKHPGVSVVVVAVRADAAKARLLKTSLPVGYDHDGAVANEYAVVVCPTITFVSRHGKVTGSTVGPQTDADLEEHMATIG
jgi:hypothetical protein